MERTTRLLDPASLKALAHPVRVRLLGELRTHGPSTATALAEAIGESSGTTSYHLRQLAAADFIAEVPDRGNGRERWWRAAQDSTRLETDQMDEDPATQAALDSYLMEVARGSWKRLETWLTTSRTWPRKWQESSLSDYQLHLTAKEMRQLGEELDALIERYQREPRKGDQRVVAQFQVFPER